MRFGELGLYYMGGEMQVLREIIEEEKSSTCLFLVIEESETFQENHGEDCLYLVHDLYIFTKPRSLNPSFLF